jgi:hypothetical protein
MEENQIFRRGRLTDFFSYANQLSDLEEDFYIENLGILIRGLPGTIN